MGILALFAQEVNVFLIVGYLFAIVIALTVHEFAHAWVADKLGDPTPRFDGRVTLNPLSHLDPIGSLLFLLVGFGWGRPVVYNPMRLKGRLDELWVALAGPASNILLATALFIFARLVTSIGLESVFNPSILLLAATVNIFLAAFNLLPIPPLDGSAIVSTFYPPYRSYLGGQIGFIILLVLIFFPVGGGSLLSAVVMPIVSVITFISSLGGILL